MSTLDNMSSKKNAQIGPSQHTFTQATALVCVYASGNNTGQKASIR